MYSLEVILKVFNTIETRKKCDKFLNKILVFSQNEEENKFTKFYIHIYSYMPFFL